MIESAQVPRTDSRGPVFPGPFELTSGGVDRVPAGTGAASSCPAGAVARLRRRLYVGDFRKILEPEKITKKIVQES